MFMSPRLGSLAALSILTVVAACAAPSEEDTSTQNSEVRCAGSCEGGSLNGDGLLTAVDRQNGLRADWAPSVAPLPANYFSGANNMMRAEASEAMVRMLKDAFDSAHLDIYCHSGYRSFQTQCSVFNEEHAAVRGCDGANLVSAHAGHSEHQLGTACDLSYAPYLGSGDPFVRAGDAADQWLQAHAHEYGFANSYPNESTADNDGYIHEPWHYRYIGVAAAAELRSRGRIAVPRFIRSLTPDERAALEGGQAPPPGSGGGGGGGAGGGAEGEPCNGLTLYGYCDRNTVVYCKDGVVKKMDCTPNERACTWISAEQGHDCVARSLLPCGDVDYKGRCDGEILSFCDNGALRKMDCPARGGNHCRLESEAAGYNCIP
jgi:LAS superfamily LD-carboxypeptidase LdcB